jgi:ABC-2 type transport system ATP-binding protein
MRQLIKQMSKNKAIVLSTHILEEVEAVCTRAIIIARGKVLFDGTPAELVERGAIDDVFRRITTGPEKALS